MKTYINSFSDIEYIIRNRLDVTDTQGYNIPFVRFISMSLNDILTEAFHNYTYIKR